MIVCNIKSHRGKQQLREDLEQGASTLVNNFIQECELTSKGVLDQNIFEEDQESVKFVRSLLCSTKTRSTRGDFLRTIQELRDISNKFKERHDSVGRNINETEIERLEHSRGEFDKVIDLLQRDISRAGKRNSELEGRCQTPS